MKLYHGSTVEVQRPDVLHSTRSLDFGCGFYTTSIKGQALRWAKRKAEIGSCANGVLNMFEFNPAPGFRVLDFGEELDEWIDFVCACRRGSSLYKGYDLIIGRVADDRVFRVVDLYKRGIWEKQRAIREMRAYETYDQYAFITQDAIDTMLTFKESCEVAI